ncbi:MAG: hypothetical protein HYT09_02840 [Candidatus Levybacteria bacterium]|nr:hypothetical protein [Candidatus Levybacteria bacterium]
MAQPRETDEFLRALAQFDQDSAQIQSTRKRLRAEHEKLVEQRRLALEQRLAEEGLVRCARVHTAGETEEEGLGNWYYWGAIETVVVRIGDRLIQSIDGEDVTHLKVVTGGFTEELYRHFGLSPVPSLPRQ